MTGRTIIAPRPKPSNTYFPTQIQAIAYAITEAQKRGFKVWIPDNFLVRDALVGNTNDYRFFLCDQGGKDIKPCLQIQIYHMESGTFELNHYIN